MKFNQVLSTNRLEIRPILESDIEIVHQLQSNEEVERYNTMGIAPDKNFSQDILTQYMRDFQDPHASHLVYVILLKEENTAIGLLGLKMSRPKYQSAEIWYKLLPEYWSKAYATEAAGRILEFCFIEFKLHRVEAGCAVENMGSVRVLEKIGMRREALKQQVLPLSSGWSDAYDYAILRSEYLKMNTTDEFKK